MTNRLGSMRYRQLLLLVILLGLSVIVHSDSAFAQMGDGGWTIPVKIYEGKGSIREPALAADQTGALHAFWTYSEEGLPSAIFYARWRDGQWTPPVDVIAMSGVLQGPSAVVDQYGTIHLVWQGPGNTLYYSSANVGDAHMATGWIRPVALAQSNPHADIKSDRVGTLHLVYPGLQGDGVYHTSSEDGGHNWTLPSLIAAPVRTDALTEFTRLAVATNDDLHVVWTEARLPLGMPSLGVFYVRSNDHGQTWSQPFELAGERYYLEANCAVVNEDIIHVAWNASGGISGRYHRWSSDGGLTWSAPNVIVSGQLGGGSTGPPGLAVDSSGGVHVVVNTYDTVPRTGTGEFGATMYSSWTGFNWLPALNISSPAPDYVSINNEESAIATVQGNQLHVLFFGDETHTLWHTYKTTSAPLVASIPFAPSSSSPVVVERATSDPSPMVIEATASAPTAVVIDTTAASPLTSNSANPATAVIIGILPAAVLVGGVILLALNRRRTH